MYACMLYKPTSASFHITEECVATVVQKGTEKDKVVSWPVSAKSLPDMYTFQMIGTSVKQIDYRGENRFTEGYNYTQKLMMRKKALKDHLNIVSTKQNELNTAVFTAEASSHYITHQAQYTAIISLHTEGNNNLLYFPTKPTGQCGRFSLWPR